MAAEAALASDSEDDHDPATKHAKAIARLEGSGTAYSVDIMARCTEGVAVACTAAIALRSESPLADANICTDGIMTVSISTNVGSL
jgi:hypothetical protein